MKILVTGAAGFIGYHVTKLLLAQGHEVVGLDNINDYYDPELKYGRLAELGIEKAMAEVFGNFTGPTEGMEFPAFTFVRMDLEEQTEVAQLFETQMFDVVCHLAAQAGVRYSLENPRAYIDSNIVGFLNILEGCRHTKVRHLVYASSSSVYGMNKKAPFETTDRVEHPISLYAATKKSNELMAHTYTHLFGLPTTGLRFFTVYGPWGRPDMALFLFTQSIVAGEPIRVFNHGDMERDFTYIDDIVEGVVRIVERDPGQIPDRHPYAIYNIGNSNSVRLLDFIEAIENRLQKKALKEMLPMQPGDVARTWADVSNLARDYDYRPNTPITEGVARFVDWYLDYYGHSNHPGNSN